MAERTDTRTVATRKPSLRERVENNSVLFALSLLLGGFLAGIGAYRGIEGIAQRRTSPATQQELLPPIEPSEQRGEAPEQSQQGNTEDVSAFGVMEFNHDQLNALGLWLKDSKITQAASADEHFIRGGAFLQSGDYQQAAADLREALSLRSDYPEAEYLLARALMEEAHYMEAAQHLEAVLKSDGANLRAQYYLGVCSLWLKDYKKARTLFQSVTQNRPELTAAHYDLGVSDMHLQDFSGSVLQFEEVLSVSPSYALAYLNRGEALFYLNRKEEALKSFELAFSMDTGLVSRLIHSSQYIDVIQDADIGPRLAQFMQPR